MGWRVDKKVRLAAVSNADVADGLLVGKKVWLAIFVSGDRLHGDLRNRVFRKNPVSGVGESDRSGEW